MPSMSARVSYCAGCVRAGDCWPGNGDRCREDDRSSGRGEETKPAWLNFQTGLCWYVHPRNHRARATELREEQNAYTKGHDNQTIKGMRRGGETSTSRDRWLCVR